MEEQGEEKQKEKVVVVEVVEKLLNDRRASKQGRAAIKVSQPKMSHVAQQHTAFSKRQVRDIDTRRRGGPPYSLSMSLSL